MTDQSQTDCRQRGTEDGPRTSDHRLGREDYGRCRQRDHRQRTGGDQGECQGDDHSLLPHGVDQGPGRRLGHQPGDPHHRHRCADPGGVPAVHRGEIDGQERTQAAPHIREDKVEGVESEQAPGRWTRGHRDHNYSTFTVRHVDQIITNGSRAVRTADLATALARKPEMPVRRYSHADAV